MSADSPSPWLAPGKPRPELAQQVGDGVREGLDDTQIGERIALSPRIVQRIRYAIGAFRGLRPSELASDATIAALHAQGLGTRALAEQCGLTYRSMQDRMARLGLRANRVQAKNRRGGPISVRWTADEVAQIKAKAAALGLATSKYLRKKVLTSPLTEEQLAGPGLRANRGPTDGLRDQQIPVRWTEAEVDHVEAEAEALGLSPSDLIRRKVLG